MIENYFHSENGYNPFVIRPGWQVAQLNYLPTHGLDDIDSVEIHNSTDEVFVLVAGTAVLLSAEISGDDIKFSAIKMVKGVTYNIPAGVWHNIAMDEQAQCMIVENDNTHLNDVDYITLTGDQRKDAYQLIAEVLK